jgi:hypothetical protein
MEDVTACKRSASYKMEKRDWMAGISWLGYQYSADRSAFKRRNNQIEATAHDQTEHLVDSRNHAGQLPGHGPR